MTLGALLNLIVNIFIILICIYVIKYLYDILIRTNNSTDTIISLSVITYLSCLVLLSSISLLSHVTISIT
jgi:hypothetical protein